MILISDCYGCNVRDHWSGIADCSQQCGLLMSPGFPELYAKNLKCVWRITVSTDAFVRLTFIAFDIFEDMSDSCDRDTVQIYQVDWTGDQREEIGRYCNSYRPRNQVESGWNRMQVEFFTDNEFRRQGFQAEYESVMFTFADTRKFNSESQGG